MTSLKKSNLAELKEQQELESKRKKRLRQFEEQEREWEQEVKDYYNKNNKEVDDTE